MQWTHTAEREHRLGSIGGGDLASQCLHKAADVDVGNAMDFRLIEPKLAEREAVKTLTQANAVAWTPRRSRRSWNQVQYGLSPQSPHTSWLTSESVWEHLGARDAHADKGEGQRLFPRRRRGALLQRLRP